MFHRALSSLLFITLAHTSLQAQRASGQDEPDATHWINYTQAYVKLLVAQAGIYRVTSVDLGRAGVPVDQLDPTTLQLFHRGVEQAIFVAGEADQRFDSTDFLEFYGRANDGTQDSLLYRPHKAQPHRYYSLFSDTTAYFLTWRNGLPGKRMTGNTDTTSTGLTPEPYYWVDELRLFTDTYPGWAAGLPQTVDYSYYEAGEGYTGPIQSAGKPYTLTFHLENPVRTGPAPHIDLLLIGRTFGNHQLTCSVGPTATKQRLLDSIRFVGYANRRIQRTVNWSDVGSDGQLTLTTVSRADATDAHSVSYARIWYPQSGRGTGQPMQVFELAPNPVGRSLLVIDKLSPDTRFWDISNPNSPHRLLPTTSSIGPVRLVVPGTETACTILAVSHPHTVPIIRPVVFTDWHKRKPTYLIISHEALMKRIGDSSSTNAVHEYARYRASQTGGGYDTLTATMQQLFDQYSYGERHPLSIRRFARQMLHQGDGAPPYLLLLGNGRSTPGLRHDPQQATLDLVMTAGFPGSDVAFTAGLLNGQPDVPALPTGRVTAETPRDVLAYLAKVREYESGNADVPWRKHWLHLSGGQTPDEQNLFRRIMESYRDQAANSSLGVQITTITKITDATRVDTSRVDTPAESLNLAGLVNEGIGLLTFFGHSGLALTDMPIGFCSNDALGYHNQGKYPLLLMNGCALGNSFYGRPTLTTDWLLTPNRGAIAAIAQSHVGYVDALTTYTSTFYSLLSDSTQRSKSFGQLQQETIRRVLAQNPGGRTLANAQQMVLLGDPAIRLFPNKPPNYAVNTDSLLNEPTLTDFTVSPNPFREQVVLGCTLTATPFYANLTITLIDLTGRVVRHLPSSVHAGRNEWVWDGRSDAGLSLPAGIYLYTLSINDATALPVANPLSKRLTGRLVLLR